MPRHLAPHLQSIDLRERILDVADRLLAEQGYAGLNMQVLSKQVGIAKGTTYLYFTNKQDVAFGVVDRIFHRVLRQLSVIAAGSRAPRHRLTAMLSARVMLRHRAMSHFGSHLQQVLGAIRPVLHAYRLRHRHEEAAIFAGVIAEGCRTSTCFRRLDPTRTALAMLWATDALLPSYLSAAELADLSVIKSEVGTLSALLTRGLGPLGRAVTQHTPRPRRQRVSSGLLLAALVGLGWGGAPARILAQPAQSRRTMSVDDRFRFVEAGSPLISPDGRWVLYTQTRLELSGNTRRVATWLSSAQGRATSRPFLREGDADAIWAPDSRSVYFFRSVSRGGRTSRELFQQAVRGTTATQRSHLNGDGDGVWQLSPDGQFFLVSRDERQAAGPGAGTGVVYVDEGSNGQVRYFWNNLWRYDLKAGTLKRVTDRAWSINSFSISPGGQGAAVEAQPDNQRNTGWKAELFVVTLGTGATRQLTHNEAPERSPQWFPDGKRLLFTAVSLDSWQNGNGDLWTLDVATGTTRNITPGHTGRFAQPVLSPDGTTIFAGSGYGTARFPVRIDVASGAITTLVGTVGVAGAGSWSADRRSFAYRLSNGLTPPDVYVGTTGDTSERQRRITELNPWVRSDIALGSVQLVRWPGADGQVIEGLLTLPPRVSVGANPLLPLLVHVPCGPGCGWVNDFSLKNQVYAGMGYAQLSVVVRGSNNYDDAFMRANYFDLGGGDLRDVLAGVDAMIERKVAHRDSLAIDGWSYGAILGGYALTQTTRFKAASLGAMVSDWSNDYGTSANYSGVRWFFGGNPWTNPLWRERSSLTHADRVVTPTVLHHGDDDDVDLPFHSMNYYAALRATGVPVRYLRYPGEGHDFSQPRNIRARDAEDLAWMQYHVRGIRSPGWIPPNYGRDSAIAR